ncbi:hypothetical protein [Mesorhizobium sp. CAU 1732]|uniref:hypothetical protein n=1 Tax=Mesorhizobium sp. CAU 1732 TaxID=3140358 RepID=UPI0032607834
MTIFERRLAMTKPPIVSSPPTINEEFDRGRAAEARDHSATIALTASARRHADRHALAEHFSELRLGAEVANGDLVSIEAADTRHDFAVIRRRWIARDGASVLELTLDHPAR